MQKNKMDVKQLPLPLPEEIVIHCFFNCRHIVRSVDAQEAHNLMERHYNEKHARQIARIVAR